ncbi:unnamed protein product (macronuclear) [Paramecium tetraurelia]|uniref:RING-type E3 ubiquitin transferase n=1 Tax=Paramecium tetraurelia TaxID=5888 RepID=A0D3K4_PARTE|nr:uncharacterized protein GSPATT00013109001 [Paramecium tetraurelia]CAK77621.1 unnamed protein product [Paramecium tetraurelia]|eukprot:XP_001445018.1 hypothetical protein (macronuclear) [Paramecium tetraurelia strain d4-2]
MQGTPDLDEPNVNNAQQAWGKLISLNGGKFNSQDLYDEEITIGRLDTNKIVINESRLSGLHCKIKWDSANNLAQMQDLSTNGTFIGDQKIGKNNEIILKNGDEIYLLHKSKVPITDIIGFTLVIKSVKEVKVEVQLDEQQQKKIQMLEDMQEDMHCPICDDLIFQCVSLVPCLHNFCGACFSDWMAKSKTCPSCRKDVQSVNKNSMVNNVVERYLLMNPDKKRPAEEYKEMESKNKIKGDAIVFNSSDPIPIVQPVTNVAPARGRGRPAAQQQAPIVQQDIQTETHKQNHISDYSAEEDDGPVTKDCVTCIRSINGYQCQRRSVPHLNCGNCASKMPKFDLNEKRLVFRCQLCENYFCTLYNKNCQQLSKKNPNARIERHAVPGNVDVQCFRQNQFELQAFLDYMKQKGLTTQDIFKYMLDNHISKGGFKYVEGKRTHKDPKRTIDMLILNETPVCNQCFTLVWQQIVFRYRISIRDQMADKIKNRGQCWFGINCNTMTHNPQHAEKLDHICEQTKF